MALAYSDLTATTNTFIVPNLVDVVYENAALFIRLRTKKRFNFEGGAFIKQPIMYQKLKGGPTTRGATFDISYVQTDTDLVFLLKEYYINATLYGVDQPLNRGAEAALSMVESKLANAAGAMAEYLGQDLYGDGQGIVTTAISLDGLLAAVDNGANYPTYGGVTRTDIATGDNVGINAYYASLTSSLQLANLTTSFGATWFGNRHVDMMISNQDVWNIVHNKIQPQQRFNEESSDLAQAGFQAFRWQGCSVCVDQYAPEATLWGLNTDFMALWMSSDAKWQFGFTGWKEANDTVDANGQYLFLGNLVVSSPRMFFQLANVVA